MDEDPVPGPAGSVTRYLRRLRSDRSDRRDEAAARLHERYALRLLALARHQLHRRIRVREDEEDVVQSALKSFYGRQRRGDFVLAGRDDLWALLVAITLHKARDTADRHYRARRDARLERPARPDADHGSDGPPDEAGSDPTPEEAAILNEELERRLRELREPELRRVALMKLEGFSNLEIAEELQVSVRTVERKLGRIRARWGSVTTDLP